MLTSIINKLLMTLLVLSILNISRHLYFFILSIMITKDDSITQKYKLSKWSLILLGASISFLITSIITGINL